MLHFAALKLFFNRKRNYWENKKMGHLITPLFKKGEFGVYNRLLVRVQWVGSRANVDGLLFQLTFAWFEVFELLKVNRFGTKICFTAWMLLTLQNLI